MDKQHKASNSVNGHNGQNGHQAAPWDKDNPKAAGEHKPMSPQTKAAAKRRAKAAGRPYPNLVDNMHAAAAAAKRK